MGLDEAKKELEYALRSSELNPIEEGYVYDDSFDSYAEASGVMKGFISSLPVNRALRKALTFAAEVYEKHGTYYIYIPGVEVLDDIWEMYH